MLGWPGRGRGLAGHTEWGRAPSFSQGRELGAPLGGHTSLQKQCALHVHGAFSFLKTLFIFSRHPPWSSERLGRDGGGQRPGSAGTWARPGAGLQAPRGAPTDGIWAVGWGGGVSLPARLPPGATSPMRAQRPPATRSPGGPHLRPRLDPGPGCRSRNPRLVLLVVAARPPSVPPWARAGVPSLCAKSHIERPCGLGLGLAICPEGTGQCS